MANSKWGVSGRRRVIETGRGCREMQHGGPQKSAIREFSNSPNSARIFRDMLVRFSAARSKSLHFDVPSDVVDTTDVAWVETKDAIFACPKGLLTQCSFFEKAFGADFCEGPSTLISLPEASEGEFTLLLDFLRTGTYAISHLITHLFSALTGAEYKRSPITGTPL